MIGLDDIAWFASTPRAVAVLGSRDPAVAADSLTGGEIAAAFERVIGTPVAPPGGGAGWCGVAPGGAGGPAPAHGRRAVLPAAGWSAPLRGGGRRQNR